MSHIPNIPAAVSALVRPGADIPQDWLPYPYIDTLYDYTAYMNTQEPIASLPARPSGEVAIIGAGAGGMAAAYELHRSGIPVTVLEATPRIGGRTWSQMFKPRGSAPPLWAELGAMRVPLSNKLFWYYANQFGVKTGAFPDPGIAPTLLFYENQAYPWEPNQPPPGPFGKIQQDFGAFAFQFMQKVWTPWYNGGGSPDRAQLVAAWQGYIDQYYNTSVYDALMAGLPQWTNREIDAFSALGVGSGGFGTQYRVSNLELLRNMLNKWEYEQQLIVGWQDDDGKFIPDGINGLTHSLYRRSVQLPNGKAASLESLGAVKLNTTVTKIERDPKSGELRVHWVDNHTRRRRAKRFAAVIVAVPTRSMEIDLGLTLPQGNAVDIGDEDVKNALRNAYLIGSSKMVIRTNNKFWLDAQGKPRPDMPQTIQTDELPRGVYCLDYPHTKQGVVIISYTWGDDSTKLTSVEPVARFNMFREIITRIHPAFGKQLVPANGERDILNVDWENTAHYYGAFKLQLPGQERLIHAAYYQFLSVLDPAADKGVYFAGDSVSWSGGWVEGALQTGLNAACAAAQHLGATLRDDSPLTQNPDLYHHDKIA